MPTCTFRQALLLLAYATAAAQTPKPAFDEAFFKGDPKAIALACAEQARSLKPKKDHVLAQVGRIQLAAGDRADAEASFKAALPGDSESFRWVGQAWIEAGEADRAATILADMPLLGWSAKDELRTSAALLMDAGRPKEAEALMKRLLKEDRWDWENMSAYARACLRQDRQDLAASWYAQALDTKRDKAALWNEIAISLSDKGEER